MKKFSRFVLILLLSLSLPAILLFFFGFFAKTTDEYTCAIQTASQDRQVIAVAGEPVTPGLFAWMPFFESSGGLTQGVVNTTLSGPNGRGRLHAECYRSPVGSTLYLTFESGGEEIALHDGAYPCP